MPSLRKVVPAGEFWFAPVARGQALRLVDLEGNEAVDTLFYSAEDTAERYSAVDTVREQGNVYLSTGSVLLSTRGNPMLEIVADTCGRHDTLKYRLYIFKYSSTKQIYNKKY